MNCPDCQSQKSVKNGFNITSKQMYRCKECGRQFVLNPLKSPISDETKALINRLLLEQISLAGIARVTGVSEYWLQQYVNDLYDQTPREIITQKNARSLDGRM